MANRMVRDNMHELHRRIARVTDDLRTIQQELNCAAMQAPSDPELMEALNSLPETEPVREQSMADQLEVATMRAVPSKAWSKQA